MVLMPISWENPGNSWENRGKIHPVAFQVPPTPRHGHPVGSRQSCEETPGTTGGWLRGTWPNRSNSL